MPAAFDQIDNDQAELGVLLVRLHDAERPSLTVQATYRIWHHDDRAHAAFLAGIEQQKRRGASISTFALSGEERSDPEHEETVRIWREGERCRVEHHGGRRDGYYAVTDGQLWWIWDERTGARSNEDDPSVGSDVGREFGVLLDPTPLLSSLRFRLTGRSRVAGRPTMTAAATPRPRDGFDAGSLALHQLGTGADRYELQIDEQRGIPLAVTALRDERPFHRITTLAIQFDQPLAPETFQFKAPEGQQVQPAGGHRLQHVTLTEAQQRAPFTVLMPDRVPAGWQVSCMLVDASERPPSPTQVSLSYLSDDGHESVSIDQMAAADRASHHYENMVNNPDGWEEIDRDGTTITVRPAGWGQAQAYLERDDTFVFLVSNNLTGDQLATIAAGLRPAPSTASI